MAHSIPYEEEAIEVTGTEIDKLANTSAYFSTLKSKRSETPCPPEIHLIVFPPNICEPRKVFKLYYKYVMQIPITRRETKVKFSDLVYLAGYLLIPECVLRHLVTQFYILPDRDVEAFVDALYHLSTLRYFDFIYFYVSLLGIPICIIFLSQPSTRSYIQNIIRCLLASFQEHYPRHPTSHLFSLVTCPSPLFCLSPRHNYLRQRIRLFCCRPRLLRLTCTR